PETRHLICRNRNADDAIVPFVRSVVDVGGCTVRPVLFKMEWSFCAAQCACKCGPRAGALVCQKGEASMDTLEGRTKLYEEYATLVKHHEELEVKYITWITSFIGVILAASAAIARSNSDPSHSKSGWLIAGIFIIGIIASIMAFFIHRGLIT